MLKQKQVTSRRGRDPWARLSMSGAVLAVLLASAANAPRQHASAWQAAPDGVSLEGLEVTQAIQNMDHAVPLIKGKRTIVRAYLKADAALPLTVRGKLLVRKSAEDAGTTLDSADQTVVDAAQNGDLRARREKLDGGLNFVLPPELYAADALTVSLAGVRDATTDAEVACADCATASRTVSFVDAPVFRLRLIGLRYQADTDRNPRTPPVAVAPTEREFGLIRSWLLRAFPVGEADITWRTVDAAAHSLRWPFDGGDANTAVAAIRGQDVQAGTDSRTHYYGVVADGGGFMQGWAYTPASADPSAVGSGPTGRPGRWANFTWDTDETYGDWYTGHEVGHTFGRNHYGVCSTPDSRDDPNYEFKPGAFLSSSDGAYVGFDLGDAAFNLPMAVLPGRTWTDVMDYCPHEWASSYTYKAILQRLRDENPPPPEEAPAALRESRVGRFIHVVALVNLTRRTGQIRYVNPVSAGPQTRMTPEPGASVRLRGAGGRILAEHPVELRRNADARPGDESKALVDVAIPHAEGARVLELLLGGRVVDTFRAGRSAPSLRNLRLRPALTLGGGGERTTLGWEASDPDRDTLTYVVQVSPDEGRTWETLAVGLRATSLRVELEKLKGAPSLKFRVIATDGFNQRTLTGETLPAR